MRAGNEQLGQFGLGEEIRDLILADPAVLLEDAELMRALVAANDRAMGENVVDLRGAAMSKLEGRLDRLEDTHRSVIAAAYENLAGTNLIHRVVLQLLEPQRFDEVLAALEGPIAQAMRVDSVRLLLETRQKIGVDSPQMPAVLRMVEAGFAEKYLTLGLSLPHRPVVLRAKPQQEAGAVYGEQESAKIQSEAVLRLDLGAGRLPALLVLGSADPQHFRPVQGTDLLAFFARVFELTLRRWLA